jgi:hypothetical protein
VIQYSAGLGQSRWIDITEPEVASRAIEPDGEGTADTVTRAGDGKRLARKIVIDECHWALSVLNSGPV